MSRSDELVDALASGLRRRVAERRRAAERLADFVFREEAAAAPDRRPAVSRADWRWFVARTLAAAGDPAVIGLLEELAAGERTMTELAVRGGLTGGDGLAMTDWIGELAAAGLVGHELASDRVALTELGQAVLALVREWEDRAAAGDEVEAVEGPAGRGGSR